MTALRSAPALLALVVLIAGCGGGTAGETTAATTVASVSIGPADPHPCDLLTGSQAAGVLESPVVDIDRMGSGGSDGEQAACTWVGADNGVTLDVMVEGPSFFATAPAGYATSEEAYDFWREDTLEAGFPMEVVFAAGDAAFIPRIGSGAANTMVMRSGKYLIHITLLAPGSGIEERMIDTARMLAAALG